MIDRSQRYAARVFAITYIVALILIGVAFSRFYAPLLVWNNDVTTAQNLIAHEAGFHVYLASAVLYGILQIILLAALFVILRPIARGIALFAAFVRLAYVFLWFVQILDTFSALRLMGNSATLRPFEPERLQALAGLQLASGWDAYYIGLPLYAVASLGFNYLFFKSRYVPRFLVLYGILASLFEGFCGFAYLVYRSFGNIVSVNWYEIPVMLFEVVLCLWLLIRGIKSPADAAKAIQVEPLNL
jgi:hypothetical protein